MIRVFEMLTERLSNIEQELRVFAQQALLQQQRATQFEKRLEFSIVAFAQAVFGNSGKCRLVHVYCSNGALLDTRGQVRPARIATFRGEEWAGIEGFKEAIEAWASTQDLVSVRVTEQTLSLKTIHVGMGEAPLLHWDHFLHLASQCLQCLPASAGAGFKIGEGLQIELSHANGRAAHWPHRRAD